MNRYVVRIFSKSHHTKILKIQLQYLSYMILCAPIFLFTAASYEFSQSDRLTRLLQARSKGWENGSFYTPWEQISINFYQFSTNIRHNCEHFHTFFLKSCFNIFLGILERARGAYKDSLPVSLWFESIFRSPWSNGAGDNGAMENVLWFVYLFN